MYKVRVLIPNRDKIVGGMVRGLVTEIAGFQTAKGLNHRVLLLNGYFEFEVSSLRKADEVKEAVKKYLAGFASVEG